jgi:hypothetical protein
VQYVRGAPVPGEERARVPEAGQHGARETALTRRKSDRPDAKPNQDGKGSQNTCVSFQAIAIIRQSPFSQEWNKPQSPLPLLVVYFGEDADYALLG